MYSYCNIYPYFYLLGVIFFWWPLTWWNYIKLWVLMYIDMELKLIFCALSFLSYNSGFFLYWSYSVFYGMVLLFCCGWIMAWLKLDFKQLEGFGESGFCLLSFLQVSMMKTKGTSSSSPLRVASLHGLLPIWQYLPWTDLDLGTCLWR